MRTPPTHENLAGTDLGLLAAVAAGHARLTPDQALEVLQKIDTPTLGRFADHSSHRIHGNHLRTYIIDRNINYTNVCNARCTFCAFRRDGDEADAYTLSYEEIYR
jgi:cyclic dehypoxanthinyl futalosine synthase